MFMQWLYIRITVYFSLCHVRSVISEAAVQLPTSRLNSVGTNEFHRHRNNILAPPALRQLFFNVENQNYYRIKGRMSTFVTLWKLLCPEAFLRVPCHMSNFVNFPFDLKSSVLLSQAESDARFLSVISMFMPHQGGKWDQMVIWKCFSLLCSCSEIRSWATKERIHILYLLYAGRAEGVSKVSIYSFFTMHWILP